MAKEYVEKRDGGYYIAGSRVSLDSVVYEFLNGSSPEGIQESYPALSLEEVFGSLAFYLANRKHVDEYLAESERDYEKLRLEAREKHPLLYRKLEEARRNAQSRK
ncbi:MAG: hypothetical protein AUG75_05905 [Cyanobacteria bacterium 13_1_20CM_4_61_6]|nr:MAG: hypothetical protein AUG75_05905 [Cyanobacteria bacterium 13_1_20CM_4_61_6]